MYSGFQALYSSSCDVTRRMLRKSYESSFENDIPRGWILGSIGIANPDFPVPPMMSNLFYGEATSTAIQLVSTVDFGLSQFSQYLSDPIFLVEDDE